VTRRKRRGACVNHAGSCVLIATRNDSNTLRVKQLHVADEKFLPRDAMHSADYAVARRLSICLSASIPGTVFSDTSVQLTLSSVQLTLVECVDILRYFRPCSILSKQVNKSSHSFHLRVATPF